MTGTYYIKIRDMTTGGLICTDAFVADSDEEARERVREYEKDYPDGWVELSDHPFP